MSRLTRRFVRPDKRGRVALFGPGHREDATYLVTETSDGTLVLMQAGDWTDADIDLVLRPDVQELLKPGGRPVFDSPNGRTPESDTSDLACLAMRQAGLWGKPAFEVDVDHPLFSKAVDAAKSAGSDEQRAFDAAQAALGGDETADRLSEARRSETAVAEALAAVDRAQEAVWAAKSELAEAQSALDATRPPHERAARAASKAVAPEAGGT